MFRNRGEIEILKRETSGLQPIVVAADAIGRDQLLGTGGGRLNRGNLGLGTGSWKLSAGENDATIPTHAEDGATQNERRRDPSHQTSAHVRESSDPLQLQA